MWVRSFLIGALTTLLCRTSASFDVDEANRTLHLAWSSYCNESALRQWTCQWCEENQNVEIVRYLKNKDAGTQGYVGIQQDTIVVAFRGSKNFANTVEDVKFWMTKFPYTNDTSVKVDHGFFLAYDSLRTDSLSAVKNASTLCPKCDSVLITGHSLGSAMATMLAAEIDTLGVSVSVRLYNFGSPRVGNGKFVSFANARIEKTGGSTVRVRREKDIVPAIPPRSIGYRHVPTEVYEKHDSLPETFVVCDGSGEDPTCGDHEETPPFPLDLLHLSPAEHTRYLGFQGGSCVGGSDD
eukprot:g1177.t1